MRRMDARGMGSIGRVYVGFVGCASTHTAEEAKRGWSGMTGTKFEGGLEEGEVEGRRLSGVVYGGGGSVRGESRKNGMR